MKKMTDSASATIWPYRRRTNAMTKTTVTALIRRFFLFWLIVSIALLGTTVSTLRPLPLAPRDFNSFDRRRCAARTNLEFKGLAAAAVWHARCFSLVERKNRC
jgi:hypothetical protein